MARDPNSSLSDIGKSGQKGSGRKNLANIPVVVDKIRQAQYDAAANVRNLGSGSNQGSSSSGGSVVTAPSALSQIPRTPLIDELIAKGLLNDSMNAQQIQAIIGIQGLRGQVPIDLKAIMDQLKADYASSTGDILNSGADWMQQLYGTNYDPNDPNAALFAQDPIFSSYAGGLAQLQSTAGLNEANDLAWFDKEQATEQAYYDMLTQMMTDPAALGIDTGGSGGGGGGGGGYGGGGGGSSSSDSEHPWDSTTKYKDEISFKSSQNENLVHKYPGYVANLLSAMALEYPDQYQAVRDIMAQSGFDPIAGGGAFTDERVAAEEALATGQGQIENNMQWGIELPGETTDIINEFMQRHHYILGDDPSTPNNQEFYYPDPAASVDPVTGAPIDPTIALDTWLGQDPAANQALDAAQRDIFNAAYDPEQYQYVNPNIIPQNIVDQLGGLLKPSPQIDYPGTDNPGGLAGLTQIAEEREAARQNAAHNATIPGFAQQVAEYTRPVPDTPEPYIPNSANVITRRNLGALYNILGDESRSDAEVADWLRSSETVAQLPPYLMDEINGWIRDNRPELFYATGTTDAAIGVNNAGPFQGNPDLPTNVIGGEENGYSAATWKDLVSKVMVRKRPTAPNPFLFGNNGTPITPQTQVTEYQGEAIDPETGSIRENLLNLLRQQSTTAYNQEQRTQTNPDWTPLPGQFYDVTAPDQAAIDDLQRQILAFERAYQISTQTNEYYDWTDIYDKILNTYNQLNNLTSTSTSTDDVMTYLGNTGDPNYLSEEDIQISPPEEDLTSLGNTASSRGITTNSLINKVMAGIQQPQTQTTVANPYLKQAAGRRINVPQRPVDISVLPKMSAKKAAIKAPVQNDLLRGITMNKKKLT